MRSRPARALRISKPLGCGMSRSSNSKSQGLLCSHCRPAAESVKPCTWRRPQARRLDSSRRRLAAMSSITTTLAERNSLSMFDRLVQQSTYQAAQFFKVQGLAEQALAVQFMQTLQVIHGAQDDYRQRTPLRAAAQLAKQRDAIESRQVDIQQQQLGGITEQLARGLTAIADHLHLGQVGQGLAHQKLAGRVVLDVEQPWQTGGGLHSHSRHLVGLLGQWQLDPEAAADARLTVQAHMTAHELGELAAQGQTDAGTLDRRVLPPQALEGLEQLRLQRRCNAQACVFHQQTDMT